MPWVKLEDEFHSNPKIIAAGLEATGLYARALSYCGKHLTDGYVPAGWLTEAAGGKKRAITALIREGLIAKVDARYRIPDYLEFNPSREAVLKRRAERAASGRKGAASRWNDESHSSSHNKSHSNSHSSSHGNTYGSLDGPFPVVSSESSAVALDVGGDEANLGEELSLTDSQRDELHRAWLEDEEGVKRVAALAKQQGDRPAALFISKLRAGEHRTATVDDRPFRCEDCAGLGFKTQQKLDEHVEHVHSEVAA